MDLISQLRQEHQDYVFKLSTLAEVIEGIRINGRGDYFIETVDGLLGAFTTELDEHARREEEFLFPRIVERVPDSPIPVMLEEHERIRQESGEFGRWYVQWRAGEDNTFEQWANAAIALRGAFSTHMQKENLIVFPLAKRILTPDELAHLTSWENK